MKILRNYLPEDKLIEEISSKSSLGANALYDMYSRSLYMAIVRIVQHKEMSEDALQNTFIRIWNSFDRYDASKGKLYTWMLRITINIARDTIRSKQYLKCQTTERMDYQVKNIEQNYYSIHNTDAIGIRSWTGKLNKNQKQVLDLIYFEGYSFNEAAIELQIPLGTVKTRCRAGINILKKIYMEDTGIKSREPVN